MSQKCKRRLQLGVYLTILCAGIPLLIMAGLIWTGNDIVFSILILMFILTLFFIRFERRKPLAKEMVLIAILVALAVVGNMISVTLIPFQIGTALVMLSGVAYGPEVGFLVGALGRFAINFFYGQGPWTPWQMIAWGLLGLLAGFLFTKRKKIQNRLWLPLYGFFATWIIYGGLLNTYTLIFAAGNAAQESIMTWQAALAIYLQGLPYNILHGVGTAFFLLCFGPPLIKIFNRISQKYGL